MLLVAISHADLAGGCLVIPSRGPNAMDCPNFARDASTVCAAVQAACCVRCIIESHSRKDAHARDWVHIAAMIMVTPAARATAWRPSGLIPPHCAALPSAPSHAV